MIDLHLHLALQTCDTASRDSKPRICGNDRSLLTRKCVTSLFESLKHSQQLLAKDHVRLIAKIRIFDDRSTADTIDYLKLVVAHYNGIDCEVDMVHNTKPGLMASVRSCYQFMQQEGRDLVYQVQDDFLFQPNALYQMISIFQKVKKDVGAEPFVISHHHPYYIGEWYRYQAVPRVIIPGTHQHWLQAFEMGCTFLASKEKFNLHWDLYEKFFATDLHHPQLEVDSFNRMFNQRGELNLVPMTSIGVHVQDQEGRDPYVDWRAIWDTIPDLRTQHD
jgi:hypothetical protein